jgi:hypothetical protein
LELSSLFLCSAKVKLATSLGLRFPGNSDIGSCERVKQVSGSLEFGHPDSKIGLKFHKDG